jgi:hypothetical protein
MATTRTLDTPRQIEAETLRRIDSLDRRLMRGILSEPQ